MKHSNLIKPLLATCALSIAAFTQAQPFPVLGTDQWGNPVTGSINIDLDVQTPSACLVNLFNITITVPAGFTAYGESYGTNATWSKSFDDCGLAPDDVTGTIGNFTIWYSWGSCGVDANQGADSYAGSYSGTNDPRWDCAELVVSTTSITLTTHENRGGTVWDFIYNF